MVFAFLISLIRTVDAPPISLLHFGEHEKVLQLRRCVAKRVVRAHDTRPSLCNFKSHHKVTEAILCLRSGAMAQRELGFNHGKLDMDFGPALGTLTSIRNFARLSQSQLNSFSNLYLTNNRFWQTISFLEREDVASSRRKER